MSINKVVLVGHLVAQPDLIDTKGVQVVNGRIATNERWTDSEGNKQESTEFHNFTVYGGKAKFLSEAANKGDKVYLDGRLKTDKWIDQSGTNYKTYLLVQSIELMKAANPSS